MALSPRQALHTVFVFGLIAASAAAATDDLPAALQSRADQLRGRHALPGLQVAVVGPDGEVVHVAAGLADSTSGAPMTTRHHLPAGSVGKTGLAAVVLDLVADGTLDLDAPVSRWLGHEDWFDRLPNAGPDLTLRRLMNHASGIPDHLETDGFLDHCRAMVRPGGDPDAVLPPREAVGFILDREPRFVVAECANYPARRVHSSALRTTAAQSISRSFGAFPSETTEPPSTSVTLPLRSRWAWRGLYHRTVNVPSASLRFSRQPRPFRSLNSA